MILNLLLNKKAFWWKPTTRFGIEIQTLTVWFLKTLKMTLTLKSPWSWDDLDLDDHINTLSWLQQNNLGPTVRMINFTKVTLTLALWPWYSILTWYCQDSPPYQNWSFYVKAFKSYSPNRQTHRQTDRQTHTHTHTHTHTQYENITFPHTRQ